MGNKKKVGNKRKCYKTIKVHKSKNKTQTSLASGDPSPKPSSSSSKSKISPNLSYYKSNYSRQYEIIEINQFSSIISEIAICRYCHSSLTFRKKALAGLATEFSFSCENACDGSYKSFSNCPKVSDRPSVSNLAEDQSKPIKVFYDLNIRLVYGLRIIGKGHTAAQILCGVLNLPHPPSKYSQHEHFLSETVQKVCETSMTQAVSEAVEENDMATDLCVAVDGSWQKRGHTSLNGIVSVTSADTGKVLDIHTMSKYCKCPQRSKNQHQPDCNANYLGTSGGMEAEGAVQTFGRSMSKYGVRYSEYLGDGDSNGYEAVVRSKPYGPDASIQKLECIGHVQKRMGTRIRTYIMKNKGKKLEDKKSLSGKGRLTTKAIQNLQIFYGLAIRRNTHSVEAMRQAVWALYCHVQSSNEKPLHIFCPKTEETWCKYNLAQIAKEEYNHNEHFHLPQILMEEMKPIFKALSNRELLQKCLKGKSQNPNESLNNLIWARLPKRTFVNLGTLQFGVFDAVLSFNDGYVSKLKVLEEIGLEPGQNMNLALKRLDNLRVYKAEKAVTDLEKKIRQKRTLAKRSLEDIYQEEEDPDNPSYCAGGH